MHRNGDHRLSGLRVFVSGPAADRVAPMLEEQPEIAVIRPGLDLGGGSSVPADVALHVLESSSAPNVTHDVRRIPEIADVPLILAAYGEPNGIVETGLEVGAADVLVLPQPSETLLFAIRKAAKAAAGTADGKIVTVFAPKGGSGKTVLATNLAVAAATSGLETLLVDLDLQFGDAGLVAGASPRATIADLVTSSGAIDAERLRAFATVDSHSGLHLLPAPQRPEEADAVGAAEVGAVLTAAQQAFDAVVVDTGAVFDAAMLAALDRSERLLLVCNPEVTSLKNVRIGLETIDRLGFGRERVSLVVNRAGAPGSVSQADIEHALDVQIAYELPNDAAVPASINRATPVVRSKPANRFARAVTELARTVFADEESDTGRRRRFLLGGRR